MKRAKILRQNFRRQKKIRGNSLEKLYLPFATRMIKNKTLVEVCNVAVGAKYALLRVQEWIFELIHVRRNDTTIRPRV